MAASATPVIVAVTIHWDVNCSLYIVYCIVYSVQLTVYNCTLLSVFCTVYSVQCEVYSVQHPSLHLALACRSSSCGGWRGEGEKRRGRRKQIKIKLDGVSPVVA